MTRRIVKKRGLAAMATLLGLALCWGTNTALAAKPTPPPPPPPPIVDQTIVYNIGADIRIMNSDGTDDRMVLAGAGGSFTYIKPRWSPEDNADPAHRQIIFGGNPPATIGGVGSGIYTVDLDGSNLRRITPSLAGSIPDWSPLPLPGTGDLDENGDPTDADWILFQGFGPTASSKFDIFAVRLDGVILINLTNTPGIDESRPIWSPLSDRFAAFAYDGDGSLETQTFNNIFVYTVDVINGLPQISTDTPPQMTPATTRCVDWARTQEKIFYIPPGIERELRTMDVISGVTQLITAPVSEAGISPDDTRIVYQEYPGNIYVSDANGANRVLIKTISWAKRNTSFPWVYTDWRRY